MNTTSSDSSIVYDSPINFFKYFSTSNQSIDRFPLKRISLIKTIFSPFRSSITSIFLSIKNSSYYISHAGYNRRISFVNIFFIGLLVQYSTKLHTYLFYCNISYIFALSSLNIVLVYRITLIFHFSSQEILPCEHLTIH